MDGPIPWKSGGPNQRKSGGSYRWKFCTVEQKLRNGTYFPKRPAERNLVKLDGTNRAVKVYQIPDAAVSNQLYRQLLSKNRHRFSPLTYAYRDDRNVHFAIQDISIDFRKLGRIFVAEFDFRKFFDSIDHEYLFDQFNNNAFLISSREQILIRAFLSEQNGRGIPQGCSISLFLANLVCWELDRRLEDEGLRFARYADDTLIWSRDYGKICKSFEIIKRFADEAKVEINTKKSAGISLVSTKGIPAELAASKEAIEFLGYKVGPENIGIKRTSVLKIKKQISYIVYRNLIHPVKFHPLRALTVPANGIDASFVTTIMQTRRYLYGNLTESKLNLFLRGNYKRVRFKGIMSFYPLIDDVEQLKELDRWLIRTLLNALRKRRKLFMNHGHVLKGFPFDLTAHNMLKNCSSSVFKQKKGLLQIPSFLRIYQAIKLGIMEHGVERTMNFQGDDYDY